MSHITCEEERLENISIWECPYRSVGRYVTVYNSWTGEDEEEWAVLSECGDMKKLSIAKDQCVRCGKIFTY